MRKAPAKIKPSSVPQALFLIRAPEQINEALLEKLHQSGNTVSFERLFKGGEAVLAIYGPDNLPQTFPKLSLLELEDYLIPKEETFTNKNDRKVNADQAFGWQILIQPGTESPDLTDFNLGEDEQFFYQIILEPVTQKEEKLFKVIIRAMVATKNKLDKVKLGKRIFTQINQSLGIETNELKSSPQFFDHYQLRVPGTGEKNFTLAEVQSLL